MQIIHRLLNLESEKFGPLFELLPDVIDELLTDIGPLLSPLYLNPLFHPLLDLFLDVFPSRLPDRLRMMYYYRPLYQLRFLLLGQLGGA